MSSFTQTSLMCISVSLTFLICVTPSIFLTVGRAYWARGTHRTAYHVARIVNNQLACLNHAINFFLYCLTGQRFRQELRALLCLRRASASPSASEAAAIGASSYWSTTLRPPTQATTGILALRAVAAR